MNLFGLEGSGFIISLGITLLLCGAITFYILKRFAIVENSIIQNSKISQEIINKLNILEKNNQTIPQDLSNPIALNSALEQVNDKSKINISDSEADSDEEQQTEQDVESNTEIISEVDSDEDSDEVSDEDSDEDSRENFEKNEYEINEPNNIEYLEITEHDKMLNIDQDITTDETNNKEIVDINKIELDAHRENLFDIMNSNLMNKYNSNIKVISINNLMEDFEDKIITDIQNLNEIDDKESICEINNISNTLIIPQIDDNTNNDNDNDRDNDNENKNHNENKNNRLEILQKKNINKMKINELKEFITLRNLVTEDHINKYKKDDLIKLLKEN